MSNAPYDSRKITPPPHNPTTPRSHKMNVILGSVFPVALIIVIGYLAGKYLELDQSTLSRLSIYVLSPALVINSLYRNEISSDDVVMLLSGFTIITIALYIFVFFLGRLTPVAVTNDDRKSLFSVILCPNNGNMGLSVVAFALGDAGLARAIIYLIGSSIFLFGVLPAILNGKGIRQGLKLTSKLPLFWAILFGLTLHLTDIKLPYNLDKSIEWLGMSAIPMALIILGMQLRKTKLDLSLREVGLSILKLTIPPTIAFGVATALGLEGLDKQVLILQTCMPTAVTTLIITKEFGGNDNMVAKTIIISTLMSFITIPIVIGLVT